MSQMIPVKSLQPNDFFMLPGSTTVYRVKRVATGGGYTEVTYVILDGGNMEWGFHKPALSTVKRLDPFC
jgi:hypothetical protein